MPKPTVEQLALHFETSSRHPRVGARVTYYDAGQYRTHEVSAQDVKDVLRWHKRETKRREHLRRELARWDREYDQRVLRERREAAAARQRSASLGMARVAGAR